MMMMMITMMLMFMFKFKRLLNMKMDKTVPGRSAHRRSCAGLVGVSDVLLGCYACRSCSAGVAQCHHSFHNYLCCCCWYHRICCTPSAACALHPPILHPEPEPPAAYQAYISIYVYIYVYAPNMASAGFDTSQSQRALQPLGHTDNKTCKRDGFFNPLLDTSDTSTIHVWKGQNGHSLSAYFLSWSSDSVVPQGKGLAGLVFKVWIQQWRTVKKWKFERWTQFDLRISIKLTHISDHHFSLNILILPWWGTWGRLLAMPWARVKDMESWLDMLGGFNFQGCRSSLQVSMSLAPDV